MNRGVAFSGSNLQSLDVSTNNFTAPFRRISVREETQNSPSMAAGRDIPILTDLNDSKADLLDRIQSLKNDLQDWRGRLHTQVKTYRQELGDLKNTLNDEVDQLKSEFQELRNSLLTQLDEASKITSLISDVPKKVEAEVSDS